MKIGEKFDDRVQALWDDIADFDAASSDIALNHLLNFLCTELDARNASWLAAVRVQDSKPNDPTNGWRLRASGYLHPEPGFADNSKAEAERIESRQVDITTMRNAALAGSWRANRLSDIIGPEWFDSDYYHRHYLSFGLADAIWAGCPVNADAELYFGVFRSPDKSRFSAEERDWVGTVLRGLKWFYRHLFLSRGLSIANAPLTTTERMVLQGLLAGRTEKEIARDQGQSPYTTHDHIKVIYRKFGITNRAALLALWLGRSL